MPLLRLDPDAAERAPEGIAGASPSTAAAMGVSLVALVRPAALAAVPLRAADPPRRRRRRRRARQRDRAVAARARVPRPAARPDRGLLGGPGDTAGGRARRGRAPQRPIVALTAVLGSGLLALTAVGLLLPGSGRSCDGASTRGRCDGNRARRAARRGARPSREPSSRGGRFGGAWASGRDEVWPGARCSHRRTAGA